MDNVGLKDLVPYLYDTHVKLNLDFVRDLLVNASKSQDPHRDYPFINNIKCPLNLTEGSSTTIYGWMKGYRTIPLKKLSLIVEMSDYSWSDVERSLITIKSGIRYGEVSPRFPILLNKELGSIVGHILGDGSIDKSYLQVFFSNTNKQLLQEFQENMLKTFGAKPRIWIQEKRKFEEKSKWMSRVMTIEDIPEGHSVGLFYPTICGRILHAVLGEFAKGEIKKITQQVLDAPLDFKKAMIRAFFDDEGSVDYRSYMIRVYQNNEPMLSVIRMFLKEMGINSNPVRYYIKRNKKRYYFSITCYFNHLRFREFIGFTSEEKKRNLDKLINKVKKPRKF